MKRLLTSLALAFAMLGVSGIAHAQDTCANAKSSYTGNETLGSAGVACTISHAVTATGTLTVEGTSVSAQALTGDTGLSVSSSTGAITVKALTTTSGDLNVSSASSNITGTTVSSGDGFEATATNGTIMFTGAINSNTSGVGGNIILTAFGNVATGKISTNGGSAQDGQVEIDANTGGGSTLFTVGGSGQSNGVNGSIDTSNTTGGGTDNFQCHGGVFITNGTASSTGGITVTAATNFKIGASASPPCL